MTQAQDDLFPVYEIEDENSEIPETLGTKEKFWILHDGQLVLLKFGRQGTGEDWAEKAACELCKLIDLPRAHYDLARHKGRPCVISPSIVQPDGRLILGNEIINRASLNYDGTRSYHQSEHTVSRVLASLKLFTGTSYTDTWHNFIGYLMLDAWIGNTDRHHENWALMIEKDRSISLAPTFDHASSMGRELTDEERVSRLATSDIRFAVAAFAAKARSALYAEPTDRRPLLAIDAFRSASRAQRESGFYWLRRLNRVSEEQVAGIFARIPPECISEPSRDFAMSLLAANRTALLALLGSDN